MNKLRGGVRNLIRPKRAPRDAAKLVGFRGAQVVCEESNKLEAKLLDDPASYDKKNFAAVETLVQPGAICMDIGANIGIYSAVLSRLVGPTGHVHAFEPVRHIRRKLRTNLAFNGARNVTVNDFALGDVPGSLEMFQVKEGQFRAGTSTLVRNNNVETMGEDAFERQTVEVRTVDTYGLDRVDFMKIDVEGFEFNVLKGAVETLRKHRPAILFEHDQGRLEGLAGDERQFAELLGGLGYSCFELDLSDDEVWVTPFNFDSRLRTNNLIALNVND